MAFLPVAADAFGDAEIRPVPIFDWAILADRAMRGWAISFLMPARIEISSLVCFFVLKI